MIKISILASHSQPQSRQTKNGQRFYQLGYADLGGAFPVQIEISLRDTADAYPVGEYQLGSRSFRVSQYGRLELNPWEIELIPIVAKTKTGT